MRSEISTESRSLLLWMEIDKGCVRENMIREKKKKHHQHKLGQEAAEV